MSMLRAALLSGTLQPAQALTGALRHTVSLSGHVKIAEGYAHYEGSYTVTPQLAPQRLATKDRVMHDDVLIQGIPYWETSNDHGTTIIIGRKLL